MKNNKFIIYIIALSCLVYLPVNAQTTNIGEVVVTQNTIISILDDFENTVSGDFKNDGDAYIYANWDNDGIVNFDGDTGLTRFIGANVQSISGDNISLFYDILFDNNTAQPAFQLSGGISVAGESNFGNGIVDNDNFGGDFLFELDGIHINTSDESHVDGFVDKVGDVGFIYPIGDGGFYRYAGISNPILLADKYDAKYFFESTNTLYPTTNLTRDLVLIDETEHWEVLRDNGDSEVFITLSWDENTTPSQILETPLEDITIAMWDEVNMEWIDVGGVVDASNQTVTTLATINDFGVFTLARNRSIDVCDISPVNTLITPNGDGFNDFFELSEPTIADCVNNVSVSVYNRWGVKVFEQDNYLTSGVFFDGTSNGRVTLNADSKLPTGTYFYILSINYNDVDETIKTKKKQDYLYVNGD